MNLAATINMLLSLPKIIRSQTIKSGVLVTGFLKKKYTAEIRKTQTFNLPIFVLSTNM